MLDCILIDRPKNWRELHGKLTAWDKPHFPLKGEDALKLGLKGRAVGQALRMVEDQWIESDFTFTRDVLLGLLDQAVRGMGE